MSNHRYGHSEGAPSERGLQELLGDKHMFSDEVPAGIRIDSQTVLDYVKASPVLSPTPVVWIPSLAFLYPTKDMIRFSMDSLSAELFL